MELGERVTASVHFGDAAPVTKTGTVVYIHPEKRFYVLEFRFTRSPLFGGPVTEPVWEAYFFPRGDQRHKPPAGLRSAEKERKASMKVISVINLKGGVGKTTTVVNMAAILARDYRKRVLVVDADSQANTTEFFGGGGHGCSLGDLLRRTDCNPVIRSSAVPGVALLPADDSLMDLDLSAVRSKTADVECLRKLLGKVSDVYDYALIDCPPAFSAASAAALLAADDVVIPIKLDAFSLRGMANLLRQVRNMQAINPALRVAGLLPIMVYRSDRIQAALDVLHAGDFHVFPVIRRTDKVDDMTFAQKPLIESSPKSAACVSYRRFVKAYLEGGAENG